MRRRCKLLSSVKGARMSFKPIAALVVFTIISAAAALGQQGRWASADDPTAKFMIDVERQWAEDGCTHNTIANEILADDFQGTSPEGKRYTKQKAVASSQDTSKTAKDCRLLDAKVRFFGDNLAMVYGSESSVRTA